MTLKCQDCYDLVTGKAGKSGNRSRDLTEGNEGSEGEKRKSGKRESRKRKRAKNGFQVIKLSGFRTLVFIGVYSRLEFQGFTGFQSFSFSTFEAKAIVEVWRR